MRLLQRLWPALEQVPGLAVGPAVWRDLLGSDYAAVGSLLRPTDRLITHYPCPSPGGQGCPRAIIQRNDGTTVAVCGDRPTKCSPVPLSSLDLFVHELDVRQLGSTLAKVLDVDVAWAEIDQSGAGWQIGNFVPVAGTRFPVYLVLASSTIGLHEAVLRLAGISDLPYLLALPSSHSALPVTLDLIRRQHAQPIFLDETIAVDERGTWHAMPATADLFERFRSAGLGQRTDKPQIRFATPPGAKWEEVSIRFINQHQVHVRVREASSVYEHTQMGMASGRNDRPTKQWELLQVFAEHRGELTWHEWNADPKHAKRRQDLAKQLRAFFGIDGDPFERMPRGKGWRTRFTILPET